MEKVWCQCLNMTIHLGEKIVFLPHTEGEKERERERERLEAAKWFLTRTNCERVGVSKLTVAGIQKVSSFIHSPSPSLSLFSHTPLSLASP